VPDRRRSVVVGGLQALGCAVVGGARCEWGSVHGGVPLVALVAAAGRFRWWWLMDGSAGSRW